MPKQLLLCVLLVTAASAASQGMPPPAPESHPAHFLQVGFLLFSYNYSEAWIPPSKSNESGWVAGPKVRYTYHGQQSPVFGRVDLEFIEAHTVYDGGLILSNGNQMSFSALTKNIFKRAELNLGFAINRAGGVPLDIMIYTGFGYRFWRRNLAFGLPADYIEDYSWKYIPAGVRGEYSFGRHWSIALDIAVRIMYDGRLDVQEQFGGPTFTLGNVTGSKVALPVNFRLGGPWMLSLETWYEFSGINESDIVVTQYGNRLQEPSSRSHLYGFTFSAGVQL